MEQICKEDLQDVKDLIDAKLEVLRSALKGHSDLDDNKFKNIQDSLILASSEMREKLKELNDVRLRFLPREEYGAKHEVLEKATEAVDKKLDLYITQNQGQSKGLNLVWAWIVGGIAIISAVVALLLNAIRLFKAGG